MLYAFALQPFIESMLSGDKKFSSTPATASIAIAGIASAGGIGHRLSRNMTSLSLQAQKTLHSAGLDSQDIKILKLETWDMGLKFPDLRTLLLPIGMMRVPLLAVHNMRALHSVVQQVETVG